MEVRDQVSVVLNGPLTLHRLVSLSIVLKLGTLVIRSFAFSSFKLGAILSVECFARSSMRTFKELECSNASTSEDYRSMLAVIH